MNEFNFTHEEIDGTFLYTMYDGDIEILKSVFEEFVSNHDDTIEKLESAYSTNNPAELGTTIHKFKPTFSYTGFSKIVQSLQLLESKCAQIEDFTEIEHEFVTVLAKIRLTKQIISDELSNFD
jgi:HPt (histidine-containing phosphotransfer) domain-containing protein